MYNSLSSSLSSGNRPANVDYATLIGIASAFGLVLVAIGLGGGISTFFNMKGFLIVVGGTIGGTLVTYPLQEFTRTFSVLRTAFFPDESSAENRMHKLIDLSQSSKTDGLLTLQSKIYSESDSFLRKGIELVIDELPPKEVRRMLDIEIAFLGDRHRRGAEIFQTMGTIAPAMGLIGTLIGLVQMLGQLENPEAIGPGMAVALLTTFYGAILANLVFLPLAGKLRTRSGQETLIKEMSVEGLVGISERMNPRIIEQRLLSFLPPEKRLSRFNA